MSDELKKHRYLVSIGDNSMNEFKVGEVIHATKSKSFSYSDIIECRKKYFNTMIGASIEHDVMVMSVSYLGFMYHKEFYGDNHE